MAAAKLKPTLADYVTIALSPALIIAMIVSLVFFLVAILYRGEYAGRLHAILLFFTFGIVLVARIAMETGLAERAPLYGLVLAFLVWVGMGSLVDYPPEMAVLSWLINAGLVGLVWWLAYQLTHSCTYIDEKAESTGTGLLCGAGLEEKPEQDPGTHPAADLPPSSLPDKHLPGLSGKGRSNSATWWHRYRRFRDEQRQTRPPGVWVVYFGLAALPTFGLGQALIDANDVDRRSYTFRLMVLYLASALGLLVTTAFLGLRRYLRQRHLEMPKLVTTSWLGLGAGLLVIVLLVGAVLPRPQAEFSLLSLGRAPSEKVTASKMAVSQGEAGQGPANPGSQEHDPDAARSGQKSGNDKAEKSADENNANKNVASERQAPATDPPNEPAGSADGLNRSTWAKDLLVQLSTLLKWIVFGLVVVVALLFVIAGGLRYLANFCDWAARLLEALRSFWEGLWARVPRRQAFDDVDAAPARSLRISFVSFSNPFHDGRAATMSDDDLARYSFEALEAWAADNTCGRADQETPIEFTSRLADDIGGLDRDTRNLGYLYARVLYAGGGLSAEARPTVEAFWRSLDILPVRAPVARESATV